MQRRGILGGSATHDDRLHSVAHEPTAIRRRTDGMVTKLINYAIARGVLTW